MILFFLAYLHIYITHSKAFGNFRKIHEIKLENLGF
jgi:hypothetical protein